MTATLKYKPYPAYRPSGVEWLEEIPAHWEVRRLKYLATVNDEALTETTDPDTEITYVDIGNVDSVRGITGTEDLMFEDAPSRARRIVRQGDIIISTVRTYLKAIVRIESTDANLIVSTGFAVIRPRDLDERFGAYALSAPYFVEGVLAHSVGVSYPAINASELVCLDVAYPSFTEQRAIAAFLDRETTRIDELVAKKERLIGLLQEKRTALISRAVTRGLDPNAPMRDSGVEWLGEIPAHWEVKRLKFLASMRAGAGILGTEIEDMGDYPVFGGNGIRGYTSLFTHDGEHPLIGRQGALCGVINLASGRFWATEHAVVVDAAENVETDYLTYTLIAMSLNRLAQSAAQPGLNIEVIGNVSAPLPPVPEQRAIAAFLDQETAKLDGLTIKVREAIDRLKELRTALISAAVTGRIDVREAAG